MQYVYVSESKHQLIFAYLCMLTDICVCIFDSVFSSFEMMKMAISLYRFVLKVEISFPPCSIIIGNCRGFYHLCNIFNCRTMSSVRHSKSSGQSLALAVLKFLETFFGSMSSGQSADITTRHPYHSITSLTFSLLIVFEVLLSLHEKTGIL